jgi:hypothetical protein
VCLALSLRVLRSERLMGPSPRAEPVTTLIAWSTVRCPSASAAARSRSAPNVGGALARTISSTLAGGRRITIPVRPGSSAIRTPLDNPSNSGRGQRSRSAGRAILAAVAFDLVNVRAEVISASVLGLHDHERYRDSLQSSGARNFRSYQKRGRHLLHQLGVWPWCHAADGVLPARWWTEAPFLEPLRAWHRQTVDEAQGATEGAQLAHDAFGGIPTTNPRAA